MLDLKCWKHHRVLLSLLSGGSLCQISSVARRLPLISSRRLHGSSGKNNFLLQLHQKIASVSPLHLLMSTELGEHVSPTLLCDKSAAWVSVRLMIPLLETSHRQE